ncbi:MAG: hypothetical protein R3F11_17085, partial [Verrucomicrobiales bacterium]
MKSVLSITALALSAALAPAAVTIQVATADLVAAYDGSSVVIDGAAVNGNELQSWVDQSPSGVTRNLNNVSGAITRRPTLQSGGPNGLPFINFNGADQEALFFDNHTDLNGTDGISFFVVTRMASNSGTPNIVRTSDSNAANNWGAFGFSGDRISVHARNGGAFQGADLAGGVPTDKWFILTGILNPAGPTAVLNRLNTLDGSLSLQATNAGPITLGSHVRTTVGSNVSFSANNWLNGD